MVLPTSVSEPVLLYGDSLDLLPTIPADSVDAIVHDPPAGIGFMFSEKAGRTWDRYDGYEPRTERGRQVLTGLALLGLESWAAGFVSFMTEVTVADLRVAKPGAHSLTWALPRTADLTTLALRLAGWEIRDSVLHLFSAAMAKSRDISKDIDKLHGGYHALTAPATEDAKRWDGWGTGLSPGYEHWILARRPLIGTIARNVLEYGTGGIHIDACRTPASDEDRARREAAATQGSGLARGSVYGDANDTPAYTMAKGGRWPKNALLSCPIACVGDDHVPWCPCAELDRQSGYQRDGVAVRHRGVSGDSTVSFGSRPVGTPDVGYGGGGGASRFFPRFGFFPKVSDRTVPGRADIENKHPTVKHPDLLRWLVRLITPPGGVVLDGFMGSGTTGVACVAEGVRFIGIERDLEHFDVARARILAAIGSPEAAAEANAVAPVGSQLGLL